MAEQENNQEQESATSGSGGTIRIQYYRSFIAAPKTHKQIVKSIGLTKLNQIVERPDTPATRGFVAKVPHLLRIIE
jgi:large subunit ribosomal protein L30